VESSKAQEAPTEQEGRRPKRNDLWKCPQCGLEVVVHVKVTFPPTCGASAHSRTGEVVMTLVSE
jgi:rubrerythrin